MAIEKMNDKIKEALTANGYLDENEITTQIGKYPKIDSLGES